MREPNLYEIITVALAHELNEGELGFTGLTTGDGAARFATSIPLAAAQLARLTHAPSLTIMLAGWVHNPDLRQLVSLPNSEFDEELRDLECEAQSRGFPNHPWAIKRGDIDFGFASGAQVDQYGNINSVCIGDYHNPKVRLIGPVLQPEHFTLFGREYIMMAHHDARRFVEKVDFISGVGYPGGLAGRRELGLESGGPELVFTPKCIFDFDKEIGRMRVKSIHPGVTVDELRESTGFDLGQLTDVPVTRMPDADELELLRNEVDPYGLLLPTA